MKQSMLFTAMALMAGSLLAADAGPKDDVTAAAKKLGASANYSWKTTVVVPEDSRFRPGPVEGKTEKDGFTHVTMSFGDNTMEFVTKGTQAAVTNPDGGWQSITNLENGERRGRFLVRMIRNFKAPAAQAAELVSATKDLNKADDVYSGDLTEAGVRSLLTFRRRGGNGPTVTNPKGSVKFWTSDGTLTKYEFKVQGTMDFNGNEIDINRDTTVEIKDVGTTKVAVPAAAKSVL